MRSRLLVSFVLLACSPFTAHAQWQFNGVPVSTAPNYQADPLIVSDGAGGAIIAWYDLRSGNYDIYAQRLNAAGVPQWTADGVPLCTQPHNQITISMVSDDAGGAVVVWYDARNSVGTGNDIYAQRVNGSGTPLWTGDGVAICQAADDQRDPIIIKSANSFVVAWRDARAGLPDIYAQALNSSGAVQWTADGVLLCGASNYQLNPRLCTDGVGGAIVTWEDLRSGRDIYARLINQFGVVQWTNDGVVVCNAANDQYEPQIVGDSAAGAFIAWYDWRSGPADMYMQRVSSTGTSLWTANGEAICTSAGIADSPSLAQDVSGGAVLVWADRRVSPSTVDIYAQRVNSSGVSLWAANGQGVCTTAGLQLTPRIIRDPFGHLVTWFDYRSGNADIYVQRLDYDTGGPLWTPEGVVLCTEPNSQENPNLCSDGTGGAIVVWRDLRNEGGFYYDVFAEHVNGTPSGVDRTPAVSSLGLFNHPNPFATSTTLEFVLPSASDVEIDVYDVAGRRVASRHIDNAKAGPHALPFASVGEDGKPLGSGVYFCRIHTASATVTHKMVIAR